MRLTALIGLALVLVVLGMLVSKAVDAPAVEPATTTTTQIPAVFDAPIPEAPSPAPVVVTRHEIPRAHETAPTKRADVIAIIRAGFARFGDAVEDQAVRVSACETGDTFNPAATNGSHAGLFQISSTYHSQRVTRLGFTWGQMFTAEPNVEVAADIYAESGWGPWTCRWAA